MVITVRNVSRYADTNAQGAMLFRAMFDAMQVRQTITVDFTGVQNATSSFVNSSFVRLLDHYSFAVIQQRLKIVGVNRQIASMIRSRMQFEAAA